MPIATETETIQILTNRQIAELESLFMKFSEDRIKIDHLAILSNGTIKTEYIDRASQRMKIDYFTP